MNCFHAILCMFSDGNNGVINNGVTNGVIVSVTSNQTNYCFPRYNAVTVTDNKMRRYYNLYYNNNLL